MAVEGQLALAFEAENTAYSAMVETLKQKPEMVHVILTGRNAHPKIVEVADTVTEMRQVKHAYEAGILAQRGIEY